MADKVTVYHPALKRTATVPASAMPVLEKSGWTSEVPKKYEKEVK